MAKVARAGEDHGDVAGVRRRDDFAIAHRAARLDCCSGASLGSGDEPVRERKKRVTANDTALEEETRFARFPNSNAAGIDAAHLAGADAEGATSRGINDG